MDFKLSLLLVGYIVCNPAQASYIRGLASNTLGSSMTIQFDTFCGPDFCAFRVMASLGGLSVLVDSGSSSLGFCMPYDKQNVTDVQPAVTTHGDQVSQCALYGGSNEFAHGWTGLSYFGNVKGPNGQVLENVLFSMMSDSVGLNGNACGAPSNSSQGITTPIGGIWGIADQSLNQVGIMTIDLQNSWKGISNDSECNLSEGQCQCPWETVDVPDTLLQTIAASFGSAKADQWGLQWSGDLGVDTGKMVFGKDAEIVSSSPFAKIFIPIRMNGFYEFTISGVKINNRYILRRKFNTIFDTGTPYIVIPELLYSRLNNTVTENGTLVAFVFRTTHRRGTFTLRMNITRSIFSADFLPSKDSIFGLPLMRYVEYIKMNFVENHMQIVPRLPTNFILSPLNA